MLIICCTGNHSLEGMHGYRREQSSWTLLTVCLSYFFHIAVWLWVPSTECYSKLVLPLLCHGGSLFTLWQELPQLVKPLLHCKPYSWIPFECVLRPAGPGLPCHWQGSANLVRSAVASLLYSIEVWAPGSLLSEYCGSLVSGLFHCAWGSGHCKANPGLVYSTLGTGYSLPLWRILGHSGLSSFVSQRGFLLISQQTLEHWFASSTTWVEFSSHIIIVRVGAYWSHLSMLQVGVCSPCGKHWEVLVQPVQ